jgi:hypothetical protein
MSTGRFSCSARFSAESDAKKWMSRIHVGSMTNSCLWSVDCPFSPIDEVAWRVFWENFFGRLESCLCPHSWFQLLDQSLKVGSQMCSLEDVLAQICCSRVARARRSRGSLSRSNKHTQMRR